jgi:hypothetical protein
VNSIIKAYRPPVIHRKSYNNPRNPSNKGGHKKCRLDERLSNPELAHSLITP